MVSISKFAGLGVNATECLCFICATDGSTELSCSDCSALAGAV